MSEPREQPRPTDQPAATLRAPDAAKSSGVRPLHTTLLAVYLFLLPPLLVYLLVAVWPDTISEPQRVLVQQGEDNASRLVGLFPTWKDELRVLGMRFPDFPEEARLFLIVVIAGALGSLVHATTSFVSYVGNRSFRSSWILWYYLRPLVGIGIALIFYFLLRGGLLLVSTVPDVRTGINPFGIAAIVSLAGMFSKQATDKLSEVFDSLFKSNVDQERGDKLLDQKPAAAEMIKRSEIQGVRLEQGESEANVSIWQLYQQLSPQVTRLPVFDENGALNCVIHQSLLYKFISEKSVQAADSEEPLTRAGLQALTLQDFLDAPRMRAMTRDAVAFVGPHATLSEAKAAMAAIEGCQDVFVTDDGGRSGRVLGWLTNGMLAKLSAGQG